MIVIQHCAAPGRYSSQRAGSGGGRDAPHRYEPRAATFDPQTGIRVEYDVLNILFGKQVQDRLAQFRRSFASSRQYWSFWKTIEVAIAFVRLRYFLLMGLHPVCRHVSRP